MSGVDLRWVRWAVAALAAVCAAGCSTGQVGAGDTAAEQAKAQGVRTWEVRHAE